LKECESWTRLICKGKGEGSKGAVEVSHKYWTREPIVLVKRNRTVRYRNIQRQEARGFNEIWPVATIAFLISPNRSPPLLSRRRTHCWPFSLLSADTCSIANFLSPSFPSFIKDGVSSIPRVMANRPPKRCIPVRTMSGLYCKSSYHTLNCQNIRGWV